MPGNGAGQVGRIPTEDGVLRVIDENELLATHDPENMRDDEAFRSAVMSAWIDNRMTRDKTLLALSSGGIGVLLTLVSTVGVDSTFEAMCFALGFLGFIVVIVAILAIFYRTASHASHLAVFDAQRVGEGPIARAHFDHHIPSSFHGIWVPSRSQRVV